MKINPFGGQYEKRKIEVASSVTPKKPDESSLNPTDTPLSQDARERAELLQQLEQLGEDRLQKLALDAIEDEAALTRVEIAELTSEQVANIVVATRERRLRVLELLKSKID